MMQLWARLCANQHPLICAAIPLDKVHCRAKTQIPYKCNWGCVLTNRFSILADIVQQMAIFLISNFCCVLNVVCFLLGNSPASEFYFGTLSVPSS